MVDLEKVRYPSMTHRQTEHKYSSSLNPSCQLSSGWTGKLGMGWQVGARQTETKVIQVKYFDRSSKLPIGSEVVQVKLFK